MTLVDGNTVLHLTTPLTDKIKTSLINGQTQIWNHRSGGWLYPFSIGLLDKMDSVGTWETASGDIYGVSKLYEPDTTKFRIGTQYVTVTFFMYRTDYSERIELNNFMFTEVRSLLTDEYRQINR
eukprot:UN34608